MKARLAFQEVFDKTILAEVKGLAKAFGLKPSQLFDYFYGDGERPIVGM